VAERVVDRPCDCSGHLDRLGPGLAQHDRDLVESCHLDRTRRASVDVLAHARLVGLRQQAFAQVGELVHGRMSARVVAAGHGLVPPESACR
jgi:hypothetical protein